VLIPSPAPSPKFTQAATPHDPPHARKKLEGEGREGRWQPAEFSSQIKKTETTGWSDQTGFQMRYS